MPGDGTRTDITTDRPAARCLDLTRLISRCGRGPLTGVDRVELAYLAHLLDVSEPLYLLVRTRLGHVLLDEAGARAVLRRIRGEQPWGGMDLVGFLRRRAHPMQRRAEADLRRLAVARCRRGRLAAMLARTLPRGTAYLNVGHSNLTAEVLDAWRRLRGARVAVLVHDTIPLDYPQFQRPGAAPAFEQKLRRAAVAADVILCNSRQTRADVERWFGRWGSRANTVVAPLGLDLPQAADGAIPGDLETNRPYFVTVGTIEPRKNHALLLDIWENFAQTLPAADIPALIIAGSRGWENDDVFRRLDSAPVMNRYVHERAGLPDGAVAALVRDAAGVLFPSLAEGYGLPPLEAIALKTPVICSELPVFAEILGNIPVYADSADVYSWKQSILRLAERKKAGQADDAVRSGEFSPPNWVEHFNLVLKVT